jgi:hypothetical protein
VDTTAAKEERVDTTPDSKKNAKPSASKYHTYNDMVLFCACMCLYAKERTTTHTSRSFYRLKSRTYTSRN